MVLVQGVTASRRPLRMNDMARRGHTTSGNQSIIQPRKLPLNCIAFARGGFVRRYRPRRARGRGGGSSPDAMNLKNIVCNDIEQNK